MLANFELLFNDDNLHSLLEPPTPGYSSITVRRAFIVWFHSGQQNEFRQVCNYFHHLESLEEKMTPEKRAASRLHEFNLLSHFPPSSHYQNIHFPNLYRQFKNNQIDVKQVQEIKLEDCIFNLEGYYDLKIQKVITTKEILKTSQMIRTYCKGRSQSLKSFLHEFLEYAKRTKTTDSVNNLFVYIKNKYIADELVIYKNIPRDFPFLHVENDDMNDIKVSNGETKVNKIKKKLIFEVQAKSDEIKSTNKIRILINDSRKKDIMDVLPELSELSITDDENKKCPDVKSPSKIIEDLNNSLDDEFERETII